MRPDLWNILEPVEVDPRVKSWKDVLRNLVFHANDMGEAWPNIETIRREVGYKSRRIVIDTLAALEHCGLIGRDRRGNGRGTKITYRITFDAKTINRLSSFVDISKNGEVSSPLLSTFHGNGEVSSPFLSTSVNNGEVSSQLNGEVSSPFPKNGEVSSPLKAANGEVSSIPPTPPYIGEKLNSSSSSIAANGELTSPFVNNSAEGVLTPHGPGRTEVAPSARNDAARTPPRTGVMAILDKREPVDYLALCKKPGWRPNDPKQTPPCDFEQAKRAVIACAYRAKLSPEKAKEFWHYNAIRRWTAIDCGSTIAELAHAFRERWFKEDCDAYWKEQDRRKLAAANRVLS